MSSSFDDGTNWHIVIDLEHQLAFPTEITLATQRPDIIIWVINEKKVFFV